MSNFPPIDPKANFSEIEQQILAFWRENDCFRQSLELRKNAPRFEFYDGPPFATGLPHYGHILAGTIKDVIPRFQTMRGKSVPRKWGWDCHGVPVEHQIEKKLGLKNRDDIEKIGIKAFNENCRSIVMQCASDWRKTVERMGRWVDLENDYKTMDPDFMESIIWVFSELYKKGMIYEGFKVVPYSPKLASPLSNFEANLNYKNITDAAVTVAFELETGEKILAWTTTPWTLPTNLGLCVNPEMEYVKFEAKRWVHKDGDISFVDYSSIADNDGLIVLWKEIEPVQFIVAKKKLPLLLKEMYSTEISENIWEKRNALDLIEYEANSQYLANSALPLFDIIPNYEIDEDEVVRGERGHRPVFRRFKILETFSGKDLIGKSYKPLFPFFQNHQNAFRIFGDDFVSDSDGTGIVHLAPTGEDDSRILTANGVELFYPYTPDCHFSHENFPEDLNGLYFRKDPTVENSDQNANSWVLRTLREQGKIFREESLNHSYPHCWRTDCALMYRGVESFFVNVQKIKSEMIAKNHDEISWIPAHIRDGRFGKILENAPDWAISRSRFWGSPIPVWRSASGKIIVPSSVEEIAKNAKITGGKIFATRHGEGEHNTQKIVSCSLEGGAKLTEKGRAQAEELGKQIAEEKIDTIFVSPLLRTRETAEIIKKYAPNAKFLLEDELREIDLGDMNECNFSDWRAQFPDWKARYFDNPHCGETSEEVGKRVENFLQKIRKDYADKNIIVVAHGEILRHFWRFFWNRSPQEVIETIPPTGKFFEFSFSARPENDRGELDLHRPWIDHIVLEKDGEDYFRTPEVLDCWFESGSMPYASTEVAKSQMRNEKSRATNEKLKVRNEELQKPKILFLSGTCGAGKTTISKLFEKEGWKVLHGDEITNELFGNCEIWKSPEKLEKVHEKLITDAQKLLKNGKSVVIDFVCDKKSEIEFWKQNFPEVSFQLLHPSLNTIFQRDRENFPDRDEVFEKRTTELHEILENLRELYGAENFLDTSSETPEQTFAKIFKKLKVKNEELAMEDLEIREMNPDEKNLLIKIRKENLLQPEGFTEESDWNFQDTECAFVVLENNKIVGHIGFLDKPESVHIRTLFVNKKFREKGLGRELLQRVEEKAKRKNIFKISVYSSDSALNFYEKNGFKKTGEVAVAKHGTQYPKMEKNLSFFPSQSSFHPADFIAEGLDQTRGWFYTLHVLGNALFQKPAFKNVIVNGIVLAEDGQKMSKSKQNFPDPNLIFEKYGADAMRFYLMNSPAVRAEDLRFSERGVEETLRKVFLPLWNAFSFFTTYANIDEWSPEKKADSKSPLNKLDAWILAELRVLTEKVGAALENFKIDEAAREFPEFFDSLTNFYIRRSRRRFWKSGLDADKNDAFSTLYFVLKSVAKLMAPIAPFLPEKIWQSLRTENDPLSVHFCDFPHSEEFPKNEELRSEIDALRTILSLGLSLRAAKKIGVRQPLSRLKIALPPAISAEKVLENESEICEELNVKTLEIVSDFSDLAEKIAKPDARKIGPKFGKSVQQIIIAAKAGNFEELPNGQIQVGEFVLESDEIAIEFVGKSGLDVASEKGIVLALDFEITEKLRREGMARELIRHFQELRKESGFEISDRISAAVLGADEVISRFETMIAEEILANEFSLQVHDFPITKELEIDGKKITIAVKK